MSFNLDIRTPSGQNVLEFNEIDAGKLASIIESFSALKSEADWSYIEINIEETKEEESDSDKQ